MIMLKIVCIFYRIILQYHPKHIQYSQSILKNVALIERVSDTRGYMTFRNLEEITSDEEEIVRTIRKWLVLV